MLSQLQKAIIMLINLEVTLSLYCLLTQCEHVFCTNGTPDCTTTFINMTKYPGEACNIPAVVVEYSF